MDFDFIILDTETHELEYRRITWNPIIMDILVK